MIISAAIHFFRRPHATGPRPRLSALALAVATLLAGGPSQADDPPRSDRDQTNAFALRTADAPTPSGDPVPRYMSLRYDEVNGRRGPGFQYPVIWLYVRQGLPVQVIAETDTWRKVRDPLGDEVWMHRRTLTRRRTVYTLGGAREGDLTPLYAQPEPLAAIVALAERGAVFALDSCRGAWCRIDGDKAAGWAPAAQLWGVETSAAALAMAVRDAE